MTRDHVDEHVRPDPARPRLIRLAEGFRVGGGDARVDASGRILVGVQSHLRVPDDHRTVERRSLAYHELIASRLSERDLERARAMLDRWDAIGGSDPAITRRWRELLDRPLDEIRAAILADTEDGQELRHTSPLGDAITQAERDRIHATVH